MNKRLLSWFCVLLCASILQASISVSLPRKSVVVKEVEGYAKFTNNTLYSETGCPLLPSKRYTFLVPPDVDLSTVSFHIQGLKEKVLEGSYKVKPASPPYSNDGPVWPDNRNIVDGKDIDIYSSNEYYPKDYLQDVSVGNMRCYKIVRVRVYFSSYNPVSGKLKCITNGELVVSFKRRSMEKAVDFKIPVKFKKMARKLTLNYDDIASDYNAKYSFTQQTSYIIMTESSIQSSSQKLEELRKSKEERGFDASIITESEWGGGTGSSAADNIRSWLQDNYEEMNIEYVLLVGNPSTSNSQVPMKNADTRARATDFYYSQLTGELKDDLFAEVTASRIPVYDDDMSTLDDILQKMIDYENMPQSETEWRRFCFIAEKPYDDQTPGYPLFEEIKTNFLDPQGWGNYRIYDVSNGDPDESNCTETTVKNAWEELKFGLMLWMTHGNATGASDIMKSSTIKTFSDEYPSIVFMGSCSNATITNDNNLTYAALRYACIGAIGGTGSTWYGDAQVDDFAGTSTTQGMLYHFAQGIADSLGAGDALNFTIAQCTDKEWWINLFGYVLFGCPDIGVYTCDQGTQIDNMSIVQGGSTNFLSLSHLFPSSHIIQISYSLAEYNLVNLKVFNMHGREVQTLVNKFQPADSYSINFDTQKFSSGIYFCTLQVGGKFNKTKRLIVVQ